MKKFILLTSVALSIALMFFGCKMSTSSEVPTELFSFKTRRVEETNVYFDANYSIYDDGTFIYSCEEGKNTGGGVNFTPDLQFCYQLRGKIKDFSIEKFNEFVAGVKNMDENFIQLDMDVESFNAVSYNPSVPIPEYDESTVGAWFLIVSGIDEGAKYCNTILNIGEGTIHTMQIVIFLVGEEKNGVYSFSNGDFQKYEECNVIKCKVN